jgi:hypothetical protein
MTTLISPVPRVLVRPCIRPYIRPFSTTSSRHIGPIARLHRETVQAKLRKSKRRAEELRLLRAAKADPILSHQTEFTSSLLRHKDILGQPGIAVHTRSEDKNWPLLTNFGITSEDAGTLSHGGVQAEIARELKRMRPLKHSTEAIHEVFHNMLLNSLPDSEFEGVQARGRKKIETMARLIDLTNGDGRAVYNANLEKTILKFSRREGDVGSPEVQGMYTRVEGPNSSGDSDVEDISSDAAYGT